MAEVAATNRSMIIPASIKVSEIKEGNLPEFSKESILLIGAFLYGPVHQCQTETAKKIQIYRERAQLEKPTATVNYLLMAVANNPEAIDVKIKVVANKLLTHTHFFSLARLNPSQAPVPTHLNGRMYDVVFNQAFTDLPRDTTYTVCLYDREIEPKPASTDKENAALNHSESNEIEEEPPRMPKEDDQPQPERTIDSTDVPPDTAEITVPNNDKKETVVKEKGAEVTTKPAETGNKETAPDAAELPAPAKSFPWNLIDKALSILGAPFKLIAKIFNWLTAKTEA